MSPDSMPSRSAMERAVDVATEKAEKAIQKILLSLEHDTMRRVDRIVIDTRNFANCSVEIFLRASPGGTKDAG